MAERSGVDLWVLRTSDLVGDAVVRACHALLHPAEKARMDRFVFEKNRHEYLATRALCRSVLATYLDRPPASLVFRPNPYGRPELDPPSRLSFNLTNTLELVACAVSRTHVLGVDAEPTHRARSILEVADTVFTTRERAGLAALDEKARDRRAVLLWTAKEAYMKARGMGMSLPALDFEIVTDGAQPELRVVAPIDGDPLRWNFQVHDVDGHIVTTCVESQD